MDQPAVSSTCLYINTHSRVQWSCSVRATPLVHVFTQPSKRP